MEFNVDIQQHQTLINRIYKDDIILLTGSGFSIGALNTKGNKIPDVASLKKILISEVLAINETDSQVNV
ncbi:MAG: hypothetical protein L7F77_09660 [Candidatus Magnetominusculus sp. LBB02]|nr:hypothetical protein [Candidatus Magnetominusculus sp. LBB02]